MNKLFILFLAISIFSVSCSTNIPPVKTVKEQSVEKVINFNNSKLDSLLDLLESNNKWMGSVAVSEKGKVIYSRAIGYKDLDSKSKSDVNTKYRIGSISKTFTATLVMKAIEENKLTQDKTIQSYFPKLKNANIITIKNLLNHRSGIFNFTNSADFFTYYTQPKTKEELIEIISKFEPSFKPNSKSEYSNSNYVLLSFILEEVYDKPYKEILKEHIIDKIALKNTYFGTPASSMRNEAFSYGWIGEWEKEQEADLSIPMGAGSIVSNPTDLNKFSTALFNGKIISMQSVEKMKKIEGDFGLGLFEISYFDKKGFGHNGRIDGFTSKMGFYSSNQLGVSVCSNGNNYSNNQIFICAMSSYFSDTNFVFPVFIKPSKTNLDLYLGVYSTKQLPFKITFSKKGTTLIAFPEGQQKTPLESEGNHIFSFKQVGAIFEFNPEKKTMTLKQGGGEFLFTKE